MVSRQAPARELLQGWLHDQVEAIEVGGVYGMRKASRRLRAALGTFRSLADRARTDPIRDELRWLARSLGAARDDEVVLTRIETLLAEEPPEADPSAARRVLEEYAGARASQDGAAVAELLDSERYLALRAALDALVTDPPWLPAAERRARDVLPRLVRRETRRVARRRGASDPHELRKAVKRMRYAYELVEPAWGKRAGRPRRAARELTRLLGERQDAVATREWLVALVTAAAPESEVAFTFGRLHAVEDQREAEALERLEQQWQRLAELAW